MAALTSDAMGLIKEMVNADGSLPSYTVRRRGLQQRGAGCHARAPQQRWHLLRIERAALHCTSLGPRPCARVPRHSLQEDLVSRTLHLTVEYSAALSSVMR